MHLLRLLHNYDPDLEPTSIKIHLASWNGFEDPLDRYLNGTFPEWQEHQTRKNFERELVLSLISAPQKNIWLFAGLYRRIDCTAHTINDGRYRYTLEKLPVASDLEGRLFLNFPRPSRQSYLLGERWLEQIHLSHITPSKLKLADFPGFASVCMSKDALDAVIEGQLPAWFTALSSVSGVYVIADRESGKLYIGSASGTSGIWGRWTDYSKTGHGGNHDLKAILKHAGDEYARNFQFGLLEVADLRTSAEDILRRESHWKNLLLSKTYGYNRN